MINVNAVRLRDLPSEDRLPTLGFEEFEELSSYIHAAVEFARRVSNARVGLPGTRQYSIPEKGHALARHIWQSRSGNGATVTQILFHILYGGPAEAVPERLWEAISGSEWKMDCMGVSALGEIVGWAQPDRFPPRNGRTSKALRSLGYDVTVHV